MMPIELGYGSNWTAPPTGNRIQEGNNCDDDDDHNMPENSNVDNYNPPSSDVNDLATSEGEKSCMEKKRNKNGNKNGNKSTLRVLVGVFFGWGIQSAWCAPKWIPFFDRIHYKNPRVILGEENYMNAWHKKCANNAEHCHSSARTAYEPLFFAPKPYELELIHDSYGLKKGDIVKIHEIGIDQQGDQQERTCSMHSEEHYGYHYDDKDYRDEFRSISLEHQMMFNRPFSCESLKTMVAGLSRSSENPNLSAKDKKNALFCVQKLNRRLYQSDCHRDPKIATMKQQEEAIAIDFRKVPYYDSVDVDGKWTKLEHSFRTTNSDPGYSFESNNAKKQFIDTIALTESGTCAFRVREKFLPLFYWEFEFRSLSVVIANDRSVCSMRTLITDFDTYVKQQDDKGFGIGVKEKLLSCVKEFNNASLKQGCEEEEPKWIPFFERIHYVDEYKEVTPINADHQTGYKPLFFAPKPYELVRKARGGSKGSILYVREIGTDQHGKTCSIHSQDSVNGPVLSFPIEDNMGWFKKAFTCESLNAMVQGLSRSSKNSTLTDDDRKNALLCVQKLEQSITIPGPCHPNHGTSKATSQIIGSNNHDTSSPTSHPAATWVGKRQESEERKNRKTNEGGWFWKKLDFPALGSFFGGVMARLGLRGYPTDTRTEMKKSRTKETTSATFREVSTHKEVSVDGTLTTLEHAFESTNLDYSFGFGSAKDQLIDTIALMKSGKCALQVRDKSSFFHKSKSYWSSLALFSTFGDFHSVAQRIITDFDTYVKQQDDKDFGIGVKEKLLSCVKEF